MPGVKTLTNLTNSYIEVKPSRSNVKIVGFKQTCTSCCINLAIVPPPAASSFASSSPPSEVFLFLPPSLPLYLWTTHASLQHASSNSAPHRSRTHFKALWCISEWSQCSQGGRGAGLARLQLEAAICLLSLDQNFLLTLDENRCSLPASGPENKDSSS